MKQSIVKELPKFWIAIPGDFIAPTTSTPYGTFDMFTIDNNLYIHSESVEEILNFLREENREPHTIAECVVLPTQMFDVVKCAMNNTHEFTVAILERFTSQDYSEQD